VGWQEDGWFAAPQDRPLTADERLDCMRRMVDPKKAAALLREIVVYNHGTAVVCMTECTASADEVLRCYNVPGDGAGGCLGDIVPTEYDDGSVSFQWATPDRLGGPKGCWVVSVLGKAEIPPEAPEPARLGVAGLVARRARTLDAQELQTAAQWKVCHGPQ